MVDCRWGYVVGAIRLSDQQLDQHDQRCFPAAAHGTEQGEPRRNRKSVEHPSVQQPERDGHAFLGRDREMLLDQCQNQAEQIITGYS
jgi:hypothetical protein